MEDDGFKLVTGKNAAKSGFVKTDDGTYIRVNGSYEDVEKAMEGAKTEISKSGLGKWLTKQLEDASKAAEAPRKFTKMLLIGNGHFDRPDEQGAHQLALFFEVAQFFNLEIIFQEPTCSEAEYQWLEKQENLKIRKKEDMEIEIDADPEAMTILTIVHGEHEVFQGILEFNWRKIEENNNMIVVGNNYNCVNWAMSVLCAKNPRINELFESSRILPFPGVYKPHTSAFSGTVVMFPNLKVDK